MDINELLKTEEKEDRIITISTVGAVLNKEQWDALWNYFEAKNIFIYYNDEEKKIVISVSED